MKCELCLVITTDENSGKQYSNLELRFENGRNALIGGVNLPLPSHKKGESEVESKQVDDKIAKLKQYAHDNNRRLYDFATIKRVVKHKDGVLEEIQ